jgi:hypothetical protein
VAGRVLYLVGGAPRVGKSALARRLLKAEGIPWLPTDVMRTVLRRVLPKLDAVDQDPVDAARLAELMYPHIEQAAEVCAEEAERFLIEGFELAPWYPARLQAALAGTSVRACFLGHRTFSANDLASYRGPKPQHEREASRAELIEAAAWIRLRSHQLREECGEEGCRTWTWARLASTPPCSRRVAICSGAISGCLLRIGGPPGSRSGCTKTSVSVRTPRDRKGVLAAARPGHDVYAWQHEKQRCPKRAQGAALTLSCSPARRRSGLR